MTDTTTSAPAADELGDVTLDDLVQATKELQEAEGEVVEKRARQHQLIVALRAKHNVEELRVAAGFRVHQRIYQILNDAGLKPRPKTKAGATPQPKAKTSKGSKRWKQMVESMTD
mgnify:CR=1 FL=1